MTDPHTRLHKLIVAKKAERTVARPVTPPAPPVTPEEDLPPLEEVEHEDPDDPELESTDPETENPDLDDPAPEDPEPKAPEEPEPILTLPDPPTTSLVRQTSEPPKKKHVRRFRGISGSDPIVF